MSEWVVMQVLLHHRQFRRYDRQQAQKIWAEDEAQPVAAEVRVGILGLGELGLDAARKLRTLGFDVAGWTRSPEVPAGPRELSRPCRARRAARAHRHPRLPAAADAGYPRPAERIAVRQARARRPARAVPDQRRPRRPAGRGRHCRRARRRRPEGRLARRVRDRAVARVVAALDPPERLRQPAQLRDLSTRGDRAVHRRADSRLRTRRAAAQRRGSGAGVLRRGDGRERLKIIFTFCGFSMVCRRENFRASRERRWCARRGSSVNHDRRTQRGKPVASP